MKRFIFILETKSTVFADEYIDVFAKSSKYLTKGSFIQSKKNNKQK